VGDVGNRHVVIRAKMMGRRVPVAQETLAVQVHAAKDVIIMFARVAARHNAVIMSMIVVVQEHAVNIQFRVVS
jgi:hypothetical protein